MEPVAASHSAPAPVCLVRQPVFNANEQPIGHRLLSSADGSDAPGGYLAAMPKGADAELVLGEELHAIVPRHLVLLSVSRTELLDGLALSLPEARFVLCLRAAEPIDDDLRQAIDRHAMRGFRLAADGVDAAAADGPLLDLAQTVMVDVRAHSPEQLQALVASVRQRVSRRDLVATGVNSRDSLQVCRRLGFDLFEGQFFLQAGAGPSRDAAGAELGAIGTMADLACTDSFERLAEIITQDPGLSMRLLRYANSAHMALPRRVGSVHEALAWLGTVAVRHFALIAALAEVPKAPPEMLVTALTRARMCQQLSRRVPGTNPEESFTVGLFSVAEAVTNAPMRAVVGELPLRDDVASALLSDDGELGRLLAAVTAFERGDFGPARALTGSAGLTAQSYLESVHWADSAVGAVT